MRWFIRLFNGMRLVKCDECGKKYGENDGLDFFMSFICCNCLREKAAKVVTPNEETP